MSRRVRVWLLTALALVAVLTAMGIITRTMLQTEREAHDARERAAHEDLIRLSLWRLDSVIPNRISQEMAQLSLLAEAPQQAPQAVHSRIRGRFVRDAQGTLRWLTQPEEPITDALSDSLGGEAFAQTLAEPPVINLPQTPPKQEATVRRGYFSGSRARSVAEWSRRAENIQDNLDSISSTQQSQTLSIINSMSPVDTDARNGSIDRLDDAGIDGGLLEFASPAPTLGPVRALWVEDQLVIARRVRRGEDVSIYGVWINWEHLRGELAARIEDLLPEAKFRPLARGGAVNPGHQLASLPVLLAPGPMLPLEEDGGVSLVGATLVVGWTVVLIGTGVVIAVLAWSMALSERRASFVSAVTHELRTPLTTFRMYTEMLGERMVDEQRRDHYVNTLRQEAERLGHLVENVLSYARIENDRAQRPAQTLALGELVEGVLPRLQSRCDAAGVELRVELDERAATTSLSLDPSAVEQVLFNLVDNAAKYGPTEDTPTIVLEAIRDDQVVRLGVRDFGPGIAPQERRRIFEPFSKARRHASGSKPGVGLGLALCRRLAGQLGGKLTVEAAQPGARFVLQLPLA